MFPDQRPHSLAIAQGRALLDAIFGAFRGASERVECGRFPAEFDRIILPKAGGYHPAVEVDDAAEFGSIE
jgi:hypothetical protein